MTGLVDVQGRPLRTYAARTGQDAPIVGQDLGRWAGREEIARISLPGGGVMQFDLSRLTLGDFRSMRQHYQLGASLSVLTFLLHQIDWRIDCEDTEIRDFIQTEIEDNWTPLTRAIGQSFWSGYAPTVLNFDNREGYVRLGRIKDLVPEECRVNWKEIEGWAAPGDAKPKLYHYDGINHLGKTIPVTNTLWYPLLMENGDYYGRKLLKPSFPAWFFSQLIHMFANRYFERFGEPVPIGRAPFGDTVKSGEREVSGQQIMTEMLLSLRNRSVVTLPNDRDENNNFDYDIKYLESQMRGADFERYLSRLDEEMSLSVFTPVLLFRTADVGSYNLGQAHLRIFQQQLNAIAGDLQSYIQQYLIDRLRIVNFGAKAPRAMLRFRKQGMADLEQWKLLMNELVRMGGAMPDLRQLAQITGVDWIEAERLSTPTAEPVRDDQGEIVPFNPTLAASIAREAVGRVAREFANGKADLALGFRNRMRQAGMNDDDAERFYAAVNAKLRFAHTVVETPDDLASLAAGWVDEAFALVAA